MIILVFGATGNLVKTKAIPALENIFLKKEKEISIFAYGRKNLSTEEYRRMFPNLNQDFLSSITYIQGEIDSKGDFQKIKNHIDLTKDKEIYIYVSLPPQFYGTVIKNCREVWEDFKIALEKPFGNSLNSAQNLIELMNSLNIKDNIYLVDHYLGKKRIIELLNLTTGEREIMVGKNILQKVELDFLETNDVESRGAFYEEVGVIKDVVQNHALVMLSTLLMQQGCEVSPTLCRLEVLKCLKVNDPVFIAQYEGYKTHPGVSPLSEIPTFIEANFNFDNSPVVTIRAGKALSEAKVSLTLYYIDQSKKIIDIQKEETGFSAYINVFNDFLSNEWKLSISTLEALESWNITEQIISKTQGISFAIYPKGSKVEEIKKNN